MQNWNIAVTTFSKTPLLDTIRTPDDLRKLLISYRTGDLWSPKVSETEALRLEVAHFRNCIQGTEKPVTPGERGLAIVRMLEAADKSMRLRGGAIELPT